MILIVVLAAVFSSLLLYWLIPRLRLRLLDQPTTRSSHYIPTPRGGGIAFVSTTLITSLILLLSGEYIAVVWLPILIVPLSLIGLLDDRYNLPSSFRYVTQFFTAVLLICISPLAKPLGHWIILEKILIVPVLLLLVVAITAVINFTNFMDGLDGLVAGCMIIIIATSAIYLGLSTYWPVWVLVGSLLGFLFWNWSPAKVFMGDVGSTFLGALFAGLVLQASSWIVALGIILVSAPLMADAGICVPRRWLAGQRIFQAHRLHLFQRLHQAGWPHSQVSFLYTSATAILAASLLCGGLPWVITFAAIELMIGIWLDQQVAVPFSEASCS